jgi:hypothetical protein
MLRDFFMVSQAYQNLALLSEKIEKKLSAYVPRGVVFIK